MGIENFKGIILEFGHVPSSQNYDLVVSRAKSVEGYSSHGQGNQSRHRIPLTEEDVYDWLDVFNYVYRWKSTRLSFQGESLPLSKTAISIIDCYASRCMNENKEDYCAEGNWIGCRLIELGKKVLSRDGFGKFVEGQGFHLNKGQILSSIQQDLDLFCICPALDSEKIVAQGNTMPELIDLSKSDSKWGIYYLYDVLNNTREAAGIEYKTKSSGTTQIDVGKDFSDEQVQVIWEYKILILDDDEWNRSASAVGASKLNELGKSGWQLLTVINSDKKWHCVFSRRGN